MTFEQFDKFQEELHKEIIAIGATKGKEYAHSEDRFANFNRLSEQLDLKNYQIGWVYAAKHIDSIISFIKEGKTFSEEGIRGRFKDVILYFELILGMITENTNDIYNNVKSVTSNLDNAKCALCGHVFIINELVYRHPDKRYSVNYCNTCFNKVNGGIKAAQ